MARHYPSNLVFSSGQKIKLSQPTDIIEHQMTNKFAQQEQIKFQRQWTQKLKEIQENCLILPPQLDATTITPDNISKHMVELKAFHKKWGNPTLWTCLTPFLLVFYLGIFLLFPLLLVLYSPFRVLEIFHKKQLPLLLSPLLLPFYLCANLGSLPLIMVYNLHALVRTDLPRLFRRKAFWRTPKAIIKPWNHPLLDTHYENNKPKELSLGLLDMYAINQTPKFLSISLIVVYIAFVLQALLHFFSTARDFPIFLADAMVEMHLICLISLAFGPFCLLLHLFFLNQDRTKSGLSVN